MGLVANQRVWCFMGETPGKYMVADLQVFRCSGVFNGVWGRYGCVSVCLGGVPGVFGRVRVLAAVLSGRYLVQQPIICFEYPAEV
jgi:hypothetical protein